ncbi:metal-sulfur cluster assembly factor [Arachidicoccus ginsenosidivorans]|jgi:metal-sulfur cluster biosynthetic enzyme|uniref:Metal-sulfur cluster assembly factor n=1 Tax=Arachidicoccus ginsenosidivorans TaxID=496057 RepID=A0A5B8VIC3_9BACT|nr:metal-sulfur cluster assembly factor [Arachidicoccus ginsenosidivorans]QEC70682.1 metal-sulfur cluster assembly factor [Arachidicoccus ginsenosidivorans]
MNIKTNNNEKCDYALQDLYNVIDPEIGLNIVDLGLLYEMYFDEDAKKLECIMTLTTQFCPMGEAITSDTHNSLEQSFPDWDIIINLIFEPAWNMNMISMTGREYLGQ